METDQPSTRPAPRTPDAASRAIAENLVRFFLDEIAAGRLPAEFLPLQSGVGNIGNALIADLAEHDDMPPFTMYTEVFQDSCLDAMRAGRLTGASVGALTLSEDKLDELYADFDFFAPRLVLRPQEISNNPAVIRQLGVIASNTALEVDIYGHVNSSHVCGTQLMNGLGGAGDFERNARLSVFVCHSIAKGGTDLVDRARSARTSTTASTPPTSSSPSRASPTCAGSARRRGRSASSTTAPTPPTGTTCTTTSRRRARGTSATTWRAASSCTATSRSTARCCPTWTSAWSREPATRQSRRPGRRPGITSGTSPGADGSGT